jgi:hypothetical protein
MGSFFTKSGKKQSLDRFVGQPYPYAMMALFDDNQIALVPLKRGEAYEPHPDHKDRIVILYDDETAIVLRCMSPTTTPHTSFRRDAEA